MRRSCQLLVVFILSLQSDLLAQVDCDEFYGKYDSRSKEAFHPIPGYDNLPFVAGGLEAFYKSINKKTETSSVKGKVYVRFVVDTTGQVQCARVVKTDNELLNGQAVALIKETEFIPAEQRGKKVVSMMVLPITFGPGPPKVKKKKGKN